jgi:acetoin utilization deacetylase AcuC-like enzyme
MSGDDSKGIHRVGDESAFMPGGFQIAALAAGGAITATDAVLQGALTNAYVLSRCVRDLTELCTCCVAGRLGARS